jgi:hypothetical protein
LELAFNELEQQLLRFLKEELLQKGGRPTTFRDPATMHRDVMEKFGLDLPRYREVMARLEHHGIVRAIAIGAPNGHLQIDSKVVEIVRQLDERAQAIPEPNRMEQAKQYFFKKWWFVALVIALIVTTALATFLSNLGTILKWFGF